MSQYDLITCDPMTPTIGAKISCDDILNDSGQLAHELYQALVQYKVVFIEDQSINKDQLCQFSEYFGELMRLPYIRPMESHPQIIAVLKEADEINMGVFGGDWHSDFSFLEQPPMASVLYSVEIPLLGGDTVWINMASAYAALSDQWKMFLKNRSVIHTGAPYGVKNAPAPDTQFKGSIDMDRNNPEADKETVHPAVCRHPDTDEKMLFISPTYTTRFSDMTQEQSESRLKELYAHCTRPEFACRFRWQENTLAVWDNRATMHYAVNDYDGYRRLLYRTAIKGHRPEASA